MVVVVDRSSLVVERKNDTVFKVGKDKDTAFP